MLYLENYCSGDTRGDVYNERRRCRLFYIYIYLPVTDCDSVR